MFLLRLGKQHDIAQGYAGNKTTLGT